MDSIWGEQTFAHLPGNGDTTVGKLDFYQGQEREATEGQYEGCLQWRKQGVFITVSVLPVMLHHGFARCFLPEKLGQGRVGSPCISNNCLRVKTKGLIGKCK